MAIQATKTQESVHCEDNESGGNNEQIQGSTCH